MAAYFLCLTAGGGVPLFYRTKGNLKPLPFAVIGSLNGVHMFGGTHQVELLSTTTPDAKVVWKEYHNSLTLIIVTQDDNVSDCHVTRLLDYIFHSMVLVYGLEDLTTVKNVERFKREIKVCYKMVDSLLEYADSSTVSNLTHSVEVVLTPDTSVLQAYLDAFTEAANSPYGCVMVRGAVAVATPKWWALSALELVLLSLLVNSSPPCSSRDVPVFLPVNSPTVPHRMLTYQLIAGVDVCVICGPSPSLAELEREVDRFWRTSLDSLKSIAQLHPRNIPPHVTLDHNILGFILLNTETHRCLRTFIPPEDDHRRKGETLSVPGRRAALRAFYKNVVGSLYSPPDMITTETSQDHSQEKKAVTEEGSRFSHGVLDTYVCADTHKCYALQSDQYQLFVIYHHAIPTYAMRSVTNKTLTTILQDKNIQL